MRFRILPVAIFALILLLGAKVVDVWSGIETLSITRVHAQEQPSAAPAQAGSPPAAPAAAAATQNIPPPPLKTASVQAPDSAVESAAPAADTAAASPPVGSAKNATLPDDPTLYSPADVRVLQKLAERRAELEKWASDLAMREQLLKATESRLDSRLAELKGIQTSLKSLLHQYNADQEKKLASLVKIYQDMKPKDAARIFEELDLDILLDVVERMKERNVAPILAAMNPDKAKTITAELAQRRKIGAQAALSAGN
jgi:flagellar motility protein MotE (MotC chaperone)